LAKEIGAIQNLRNSFDPILSVILMALDSPAIFVRTKALGVIVTSDSTILSAVRVDFGSLVDITHLPVNSQTSVEVSKVIFSIAQLPCAMLGKYATDSPKVASDYYQKIADRTAVCRSLE
jgi:cohesin loading factor subunit SCC2